MLLLLLLCPNTLFNAMCWGCPWPVYSKLHCSNCPFIQTTHLLPHILGNVAYIGGHLLFTQLALSFLCFMFGGKLDLMNIYILQDFFSLRT